MPRTWKQIKSLIQKAGVKDDDEIFMIDIGPECKTIYLDRSGTMVEIADEELLVDPKVSQCG